MGTRTRGNENEGETYRVRTRLELTGVVSERVLTVCSVVSQVYTYHRGRHIQSVGDVLQSGYISEPRKTLYKLAVLATKALPR